jgi:hypothetical protein
MSHHNTYVLNKMPKVQETSSSVPFGRLWPLKKSIAIMIYHYRTFNILPMSVCWSVRPSVCNHVNINHVKFANSNPQLDKKHVAVCIKSRGNCKFYYWATAGIALNHATLAKSIISRRLSNILITWTTREHTLVVSYARSRETIQLTFFVAAQR